jgi:hypothetical protein
MIASYFFCFYWGGERARISKEVQEAGAYCQLTQDVLAA